jgi:cyanophycin synthetase
VLCVDLGAEPPLDLVTSGPRKVIEHALHQLELDSATKPECDPRAVPSSTNPVEWAGWLAIALQRLCEVPVERSFHRSSKFAFEILHERTGKAAAYLALRLLNHVLYGREPEFTLEREVATLARLNRSYDHGPVGRAIATQARRRGIPLQTVDPRGRIVELGDGCFRQRILGTMTSRTPSLGIVMTDDKLLTSRFLAAAGFPVPTAIPVRDVEQAAERAARIGYPVVLKPMDQADSYLVFVDIRDETELRARFETIDKGLKSRTKPLLLERFVPGNVYRALIVGDRVVGVFQRVPAHVFGDGTHSIQHLVDHENAQPRRHRSELHPIHVNAETLLVLERQHLTLDSIPEAGRRVELKPQIGHKRDGGLARDCTDELHLENARLLVEATRTFGLDVAGIDFVTRDCARTMLADAGAIIEINARPDFERHLRPSEGASRNAAPALLEMLFPPGQPVRIPVVAVIAGPNSLETCRQLAAHHAALGRRVGLTTRDGIVINGLTRRDIDGRNPTGPRTVRNNLSVDVAVVEVDAESIVLHGLGFDFCDVVVMHSISGLLRPTGDPIETVLLDALDDRGVLVAKADDPAVLALAEQWPGTVILNETDPASISAALESVPMFAGSP